MSIETLTANPDGELDRLEEEYEAAKPFLKRLTEYWADQHALAVQRCADAALTQDQRTMAVGEVNVLRHAVSAHEFLYTLRVAYWTSKKGEFDADIEHERREAESDGGQGRDSGYPAGLLNL